MNRASQRVGPLTRRAILAVLLMLLAQANQALSLTRPACDMAMDTAAAGAAATAIHGAMTADADPTAGHHSPSGNHARHLDGRAAQGDTGPACCADGQCSGAQCLAQCQLPYLATSCKSPTPAALPLAAPERMADSTQADGYQAPRFRPPISR